MVQQLRLPHAVPQGIGKDLGVLHFVPAVRDVLIQQIWAEED
jgi:hypothetical protein